jgi:hypothetical protein
MVSQDPGTPFLHSMSVSLLGSRCYENCYNVCTKSTCTMNPVIFVSIIFLAIFPPFMFTGNNDNLFIIFHVFAIFDSSVIKNILQVHANRSCYSQWMYCNSYNVLGTSYSWFPIKLET